MKLIRGYGQGQASGKHAELPVEVACPGKRAMALPNGRFAAFVVLLGLGLLFAAGGAKAGGCAVPYNAGTALPFHAGAGKAYEPANPQLLDAPNQPFSIVGLWHLTYTATYDNNFPPGQPATPPFPFLESYKTWHGDGTEFENAFLPPAAGNICFGVWKDLGRGSVKLHHVGLMFSPVDGSVANTFTIDEIDTVAPDGKTYKGTFDFKLFDAGDVYGTGTPISEVKGTTAGTRIIVN
jgi:hypothetical protein